MGTVANVRRALMSTVSMRKLFRVGQEVCTAVFLDVLIIAAAFGL